MGGIPVAAVVGPTASGKSKLAAVIAKNFGGEVVSADSMQIYKGMDIGTAKPSKEEMLGVPHHLIGFLEPGEPFSAADYVEAASKTIREICARGHLPVIAGGTGLYVRSLLYNISFPPESRDPGLRAALYEKAEKDGAKALWDELRSFDPEAAAKIHPNNLGRTVRAIEIYRVTGVTMTEHVRRSREAPTPYDVCAIGLTFSDRAALYGRINVRVDKMVADGLPEEARKIAGLKNAPTAMQAIGYKEFIPYFEGRCTLNDSVEQIKRETRRYAKRQLTWFRRGAGIHWITVDACADFAEEYGRAAEFIEAKGWRRWTAADQKD
jgi:tRNA dimethylallyltransferase